MDNPVSYFASQALNARAAVIDSLKDAMGQAVQTITAADKGITAISTMIEQAKGIAQSASSASGIKVTLTPAATIAGGNASSATIGISASMTAGETVTVGSTTLTGVSTTAGMTSVQFYVTGVATTDALNLKTAIAANFTGYTVALTTGTTLISVNNTDSAGEQANIAAITKVSTASTITATAEALGAVLTLGGVALTSVYSAAKAATSATNYYKASATAADTATTLKALITANTTLSGLGYSATAESGVVTVSRAKYDITTAMYTAPTTGITAALSQTTASDLKSLQTQFNDLLFQMDKLALDSGYKGKNLLNADTMTVKFEGTTLSVVGFSAKASDLGVADATWVTGGSVDTSTTALDTASSTMRTEASKLSGNLSIITVRQQFSTNMINTLNAGSDALTLADTNEEGANMLMLQTRQSLATTALSLSAQAAQSVLRLFQ